MRGSRSRNFRMHAVAAFAPLLHRDCSGFAAAEDQTIDFARRKILVCETLLLDFLFVGEWRAQNFPVNDDHRVHVALAGLSRNGEDHDAASLLDSGTKSRIPF